MLVQMAALLLVFGFTGRATEASDKFSTYQQRYQLASPDSKLVDNTGDDFEMLYGTRNFRQVLTGVQYRGGGNNYYHRTARRDNRNPLPNDGLQNLCEEGFSEATYLYARNFSTAPAKVSCISRITNLPNTLVYSQLNPQVESDLRQILEKILSVAKESQKGPIYTHCWNGWHASGLASAISLRQFCGWSGSRAVDYWNQNTDGNNVGASYERIREKIRNYQPSPDLTMPQELIAAICPR